MYALRIVPLSLSMADLIAKNRKEATSIGFVPTECCYYIRVSIWSISSYQGDVNCKGGE
jgi:hypothetical protein